MNDIEEGMITPGHINEVIKDESYHVFEKNKLTVCCLTLKNGFNVTGESACVKPENFNIKLGQELAKIKAMDKIWMLEGYLLKQKLFDKKTQELKNG